MAINSITYILFLAVTAIVYYFIPQKIKIYYLLVLNYIFYSFFDWKFSLLLIFVTVAGFVTGNIIYKANAKSKKLYLIVYLFINFGILCFYKYIPYYFSVIGLNSEIINIILPIGLSYYIFQTSTFVVDIYRGSLTPNWRFKEFAVFTSFFPLLLAGPIERASRILPQIRNLYRPSKVRIKSGFIYITIGMLKSLLIGDACGKIVDHIFAEHGRFNSPELLLASLLFFIQIYASFSGYSNIAKGTALLFNIEIIDNFNFPYMSKNIPDFWRRWHISLSQWFRDYLFLPLTYSIIRFMQKSKLRLNKEKTAYITAIFIVMALIGIWHGATINYFLWGVLQAVMLSLSLLTKTFRNKYRRKLQINKNNNAANVFQIIITLILIYISWLLFRSNNIETFVYFIKNIINWQGSDFTYRYIKIFITFLAALVIVDFAEYQFRYKRYNFRFFPSITYGFTIITWLIMLIYIYQNDSSPFLYSQY